MVIMPEKTYVPKELSDAGLPPTFDRRDVVYMKFVKDGKLVRVARIDPSEGMVMALYPTENPNEFSGEAFANIDDNSPRRMLEASKIKDEIWVGLMSDRPVEDLLTEYKCQMLGVYPSGSYIYRNGNRTFHIIEQDEPSITV